MHVWRTAHLALGSVLIVTMVTVMAAALLGDGEGPLPGWHLAVGVAGIVSVLLPFRLGGAAVPPLLATAMTLVGIAGYALSDDLLVIAVGITFALIGLWLHLPGAPDRRHQIERLRTDLTARLRPRG